MAKPIHQQGYEIIQDSKYQSTDVSLPKIMLSGVTPFSPLMTQP